MKKKIFSFLIFLFLSSCGYETVNSLKNRIKYDFAISELNFTGDREINLQIKQELNNYSRVEKDTIFILNISSTSEKIILTKDSSGDPTNFKIQISIDVGFVSGDNLKGNFKFIESFNYNNDSNKFDLKSYEKRIKKNLAKTITEELIFKLSTAQ